MIVTRKEKETNQQTLRRFNRLMQASNMLQKAREIKEFVKDPNRQAVRKSAVRREKLRAGKQWY